MKTALYLTLIGIIPWNHAVQSQNKTEKTFSISGTDFHIS
jgi:hypothetical protein